MKTVGIIAEYNPFHNGHSFHITQAKEITGADYCIVIMSGNYVQRGVPAIMDKVLRTRVALLGGADLVIELPVHYAAASAEYFAGGAAALLDRLGVVDCLCFGSECGHIEPLLRLSGILSSESEAFQSLLQKHLKAGSPYPQARSYALNEAFPQLADEFSLLEQPNNILGVEYVKAIQKRRSRITPYTISRTGGAYHDASLHTAYASALAIRDALSRGNDISMVKEWMPASIYKEIEKAYQKCFPLFPDDFSPLLIYKIIQGQDAGFDAYFDIDKDFSDKIRNQFRSYTGFPAFCGALKSKNMTYARISRNLLHILLNIYQADIDLFRSEDYVYYAKILGFQKNASPLLSKIKAEASIPLISKMADASRLLTPKHALRMLAQEIQADEIYRMIMQQKFHTALPNEYQRQIVLI